MIDIKYKRVVVFFDENYKIIGKEHGQANRFLKEAFPKQTDKNCEYPAWISIRYLLTVSNVFKVMIDARVPDPVSILFKNVLFSFNLKMMQKVLDEKKSVVFPFFGVMRRVRLKPKYNNRVIKSYQNEYGLPLVMFIDRPEICIKPSYKLIAKLKKLKNHEDMPIQDNVPLKMHYELEKQKIKIFSNEESVFKPYKKL